MPSPSPNDGAGFRGFQDPNTAASDFNALDFLVSSILARVATCTLVQVMGVSNDGGVSPVGTVDIMPLVNQLDGANNAVPHGTIYGCPYVRIQGGANAVIIDPQVGDIGLAAFASRDISAVAATKAQANPGSLRRFDMSDGLYVGGLLNAAPTQYIQFTQAGITIHSPTAVTVVAPAIGLQGPTTITGPLTVTGPASFEGGGALTGTFSVNGVEMDEHHTHPYDHGNTGGVNP
jgi:hypothetical protein